MCHTGLPEDNLAAEVVTPTARTFLFRKGMNTEPCSARSPASSLTAEALLPYCCSDTTAVISFPDVVVGLSSLPRRPTWIQAGQLHSTSTAVYRHYSSSKHVLCQGPNGQHHGRRLEGAAGFGALACYRESVGGRDSFDQYQRPGCYRRDPIAGHQRFEAIDLAVHVAMCNDVPLLQ